MHDRVGGWDGGRGGMKGEDREGLEGGGRVIEDIEREERKGKGIWKRGEKVRERASGNRVREREERTGKGIWRG